MGKAIMDSMAVFTEAFEQIHLMEDDLALFVGPKKYEVYKTKAAEEYRRACEVSSQGSVVRCQ